MPDIRFGIWINTSYDDETNYFFGEHIVYIDKFRPSRVNLHWESLDEMMHTVSYWVKCKDLYKKDMIAAYEIKDWDEFCQEAIDQHYRDSHQDMDRDEFIRNHADELDWVALYKYGKLSDDLKKEFSNYIGYFL